MTSTSFVVLLLLVVGVGGCTERTAGEQGTVRLSLVRPAGDDPLAGAEQVDLYLSDPGRHGTPLDSTIWPPTEDPAHFTFMVPPRGQDLTFILAGVPADGGPLVALGRSRPFNLSPDLEVEVPIFVGVPNRFVVAPAALETGRSGHTLWVLPDGRMLAVGGAAEEAGGTPVTLAPVLELLDLVHGTTCTPETQPPCFTGVLPPPRVLHATAVLPDGGIAIFGGLDEEGAPLADLWLLAPGGTSEQYDLSSTVGARAGTAMAVIGAGPDQGRLLLVGGCGGVGLADCPETVHVVSPDGSSRTVAGVKLPRFRPTATALDGNGDVIVAGGRGPDGPAGTLYLFDSASGKMSPVAGLATPREDHFAAVLPDGAVLFGGGRDAGGAPLASAEVFVPALPPAGGVLPTAALSEARAGAAAVVLTDGSVVVIGGTGAGDAPLDSLERFEPQGAQADRYEGAFASLGVTLPAARDGLAAAVSADGAIVVAGGRTADEAPTELLILVPCLADEGTYTCPAL